LAATDAEFTSTRQARSQLVETPMAAVLDSKPQRKGNEIMLNERGGKGSVEDKNPLKYHRNPMRRNPDETWP